MVQPATMSPVAFTGTPWRDPGRGSAGEAQVQDLAAPFLDADKLNRVQRLAVGIHLVLIGLEVENRLGRRHVDERHGPRRVDGYLDLHACSSLLGASRRELVCCRGSGRS